MVILIRCFFYLVFFFIWLSLCSPPPAFPQQESTLSELPLLNEDSIPKSIDISVGQTITSNSFEESQLTSFPQYPFLPNFKEVAIPGQIKLGNNTLDLIYQFQLNSGIKNFTTFASFLIIKSQQAIESGESKEAVRLAGAAKKMAPNFPQPYWALARAYWAESKINFYKVAKECLKGFFITFKNFRSFLLFFSNIYFIFFLAFFLTLILFALILLAKYFSLLTYDIAEFLSVRETHTVLGYIWAGTIVLFPIVLGLGPILIACYWLIILTVYVTKKEKQVIWVIFLICILLPWGFGNAASMILACQPGIVTFLHRANNEDWSPEIEKRLESWSEEHPQDKSVLFTLGLVKKREGEYAQAETYYKNLLKISPSAEKVIGNLANVYMAKGLFEKARETYEKAIEINERVASFHYNLYRTYLELYKFLEARKKQELLIARKLNPELIEHQEKIFNPTINNRLVIDETLTFKQFWDKTFLRSKEREIVASFLWAPFFRGVSYKYGIFIFILLFLLISFLFFKNIQKGFSARCNQCGQAIKRKIRHKQLTKFPDICPHCVSIFVEKKKIDHKIKDKKLNQVERHQKRQNIIWKLTTYTLPGGGHLWVGFPGLAALYLFIFFCFILKVVFWNGILRDPLSLYVSGSLTKTILFGLLFLGFYFFVVWHSYQKKENLIGNLQVTPPIRDSILDQSAKGENGKLKKQ